jgi:hypothetical protein
MNNKTDQDQFTHWIKLIYKLLFKKVRGETVYITIFRIKSIFLHHND